MEGIRNGCQVTTKKLAATIQGSGSTVEKHQVTNPFCHFCPHKICVCGAGTESLYVYHKMLHTRGITGTVPFFPSPLPSSCTAETTTSHSWCGHAGGGDTARRTLFVWVCIIPYFIPSLSLSSVLPLSFPVLSCLSLFLFLLLLSSSSASSLSLSFHLTNLT